jgi:hypothetical protein
MKDEHDVRIAGREGVALSLVRELIDRKFEAPQDTMEFLQLYCRCLITIGSPETTLLTGAPDSVQQTTASDQASGPRGDF